IKNVFADAREGHNHAAGQFAGTKPDWHFSILLAFAPRLGHRHLDLIRGGRRAAGQYRILKFFWIGFPQALACIAKLAASRFDRLYLVWTPKRSEGQYGGKNACP